MLSSEMFTYCKGKYLLHFRAKNRSAKATLGAEVNEGEICRRLGSPIVDRCCSILDKVPQLPGL